MLTLSQRMFAIHSASALIATASASRTRSSMPAGVYDLLPFTCVQADRRRRRYGRPAMTIVGLGGSLRHGSTSRAALERALAGAEAAGADTVMLDLRELDLPMFDPEHEE